MEESKLHTLLGQTGAAALSAIEDEFERALILGRVPNSEDLECLEYAPPAPTHTTHCTVHCCPSISLSATQTPRLLAVLLTVPCTVCARAVLKVCAL